MDDAAKMVIDAAETMEVAAMKGLERHRTVTEVYDKVEGEMNAALKNKKMILGATAAATHGSPH